jgi:hypothetical protein
VGTEAEPQDWPIDIAVGRLQLGTATLGRIAATYPAVDPEDTSADERRRVAEAALVVERAIDLVSSTGA